MKKYRIFLSILPVIGAIFAMSISSCSCKADDPKEHTHEAKTEWVSDESSHWHECTHEGCLEKLDEASHTFGDWIIEKEPTCVDTGIKYKVCSVCNFKITEKIEALGHKAKTEWSKDATSHWHDCEVCNEKLDKADHTYGEWTVLKEPKCFEEGKKERTCTVCGYKEIASIPTTPHESSPIWESNATSHWHSCTHEGCHEKLELADHTYGEWTILKEATCANKGVKTRTCSICGYVETVTIPETGNHTLSEEFVSDDEAHWKVCTECGERFDVKKHISGEEFFSDDDNHWKECTVCGRKLETTPHTYSPWTTTLEPTPDNDGSKERTCSVCGHKQVVVIPALGHNVSSEWSYDENEHYHECLDCGKKFDTAAHSYTEWLTTTPATCTEAGSKERTCTVCGYKETAIIPQLNHQASEEWFTDETSHWHTCVHEGCSELLDKADHTFGEWTTTLEPTCENDGYKERTCSVCGYKEIVTLDKLGHKPNVAWVNDETHHWHTCQNEGCTSKIDYEVHQYTDWTVTKEATCLEDGSRERTCTTCGYLDVEVIPKLGHDINETWETDATHHWHTCKHTGCDEKFDFGTHTFSDWVITKPSTCVEEGSKERICSACGYKEVVTIPVIEHTISAEWTADENQHWHACSTCDGKFELANHTFNEWNVTKEPTCYSTGSRERTCTICGHKQVETLPCLEHDKSAIWSFDGLYHWHDCNNCDAQLDKELHSYGDVVVTQAPTCSETGVGYRECTTCHQRIYVEVPFDSNAHTSFEPVKIVNPTIDSEGYISQKCSSCGKEYTYNLPTIDNCLGLHYLNVSNCDVSRNATATYDTSYILKNGPLKDAPDFLKEAMANKLKEQSLNFIYPEVTFEIYKPSPTSSQYNVRYHLGHSQGTQVSCTDLSNTDIFRCVGGDYYLTENYIRTSGILSGPTGNNEYLVQVLLNTKIQVS